MKKIIVITLLLYGICFAYSQTDSLLLRNYEQKILENSKLKNDLQIEKQNFSDLAKSYKENTLALQQQIKDLQQQIKDLQKEIEAEKQKVSNLNINKVKAERDILLHKVDSLNNVISLRNDIISDKDKQIATVKKTGEQKALEEKEKGKAEVLANILNSYKNRPFDELIKSSTKESVRRDMQLIGDEKEVQEIQVLKDLYVYFNVEESLAKKYDAAQNKTLSRQLEQVKQQSMLLNKLKEDVEFYEDYNNAFKVTIGEIVSLDSRKSADSDSEIQKMKFNEIVGILSDYMYNYYEYGNYPYLSDIVLEIINRKRFDADADIKDLLVKL